MRVPRLWRSALVLSLILWGGSGLWAQESSVVPNRSAGLAESVTSDVKNSDTAPETEPLQRTVTLDLRDVALRTVLDEIDRVAKLRLSYSARVVPIDERVTVRVEDLAVADVFAKIFEGHSIEPTVSESGAVILVRSRLQDARVLGVVTDAATEAPIPGAEVSLSGTRMNAVAGADGRFVITGVPAGTYTLEVRSVGYAPVQERDVRVGSEDVVVDIVMESSAIHLEDLIVTGVVDPISEAKIPFSVGTVSSEDLPVPLGDATAMITGKIAGVSLLNAATPGGQQYIQIRTPTTISKEGAPMYVVDGVILSDESNPVDIDALDVESIEIVKGAAAASLYGSRAAAGVIAITTKRGSDLAEGDTRITVRSEYGANNMPKLISLNESHWFETNAQGEFIDSNGDVVRAANQRAIASDRISDKAYPGSTHDNYSTFFHPGDVQAHSVSISQNRRSTNFLASFNAYRQSGVLRSHDGYERNTFRLNLDHRLSDDLSVSLTATHIRSHRDNVIGSPFSDFMAFPPDVDLGERGDDGEYLPYPDSTINTSNPIWRQTSRDNTSERSQSLLRGAIRYQPISWLRFDGDLGYDRADQSEENYTPVGTPTSLTGESNGEVRRDALEADALNGSLSVSAMHRFFDRLTARVTLRGLMERQSSSSFHVSARDLFVGGIPSVGLGQARPIVGSQQSEIRSTGYFVQAGLDYDGKYIGDLLVRRDGSSLFGPDTRWNNYYRAAFAYRLSEEPWWPMPFFDEFKLRASVGTAGGRPGFADQYETYLVSYLSATRSTLGNRRLKPSFTREVEVGADMIAFGRVGLELTYARQVSSDQIIQMPQPAVAGYRNRWENAGVIEGYSVEAAVRADLYRGKDTKWTMNLIADRSRNEITEWDRECFISGLTRHCAGYRRGDVHGYRFVQNADQLPAKHAGSADHFQINDDGYLVPVGAGNSWEDGLEKGLWGSTVTIDGTDYDWGLPITMQNASLDADSLVHLGSMAPDVRFGIGNTVTWKDISIYGLIDWQVGGLVHNVTRQRLYQTLRAGDVDQSGKPDSRKKPIDYYQRLGSTGNTVIEPFIESGGFVKLRELSIRYDLSNSMMTRLGLSGLGTERVSVALIGRNLFTRTDYSGFDPEVGSIFYRSDNLSYPNFRTITGSVEIVF